MTPVAESTLKEALLKWLPVELPYCLQGRIIWE